MRALFHDLPAAVTQFFRDPAAFIDLAKQVIPKLTRGRLFRRQEVSREHWSEPPLASTALRPERLSRQTGRDAADLAHEAGRIAGQYAPPFVVVDQVFDVVHFSARLGRYLEPASGEATLNLLRLTHEELRPDLRALLHRVLVTGEAAHSSRLPLATGASVTLLVQRMRRLDDEPHRLVVVFRNDGEEAPQQPEPQEEQVWRLEAGLPHWPGEPRQAVRTKSAESVWDFARASLDKLHVFESSQTTVAFLANDLTVRSFTPSKSELFPLREGDIGRPITHIATQSVYPELAEDVHRVLQTAAATERDVYDAASGKRYFVQVLPHRGAGNAAAGVVLIAVDITKASRGEEALRGSDGRFRLLADAVSSFLFITDAEGAWDYVNPSFSAFTGLARGMALGGHWLDVVHPDDAQATRDIWQQAISSKTVVAHECRMRDAGGRWHWQLMQATPQFDAVGQVSAWFGSCISVDERHQAERSERLLRGQLQHRVKNVLSVVRSILTRTLDSSRSMDDVGAHLSGRIGALARTQTVLSRAPEEAIMLEDLIIDEFAAQGGQDHRQIELEGPAVMLPDKVAETFGLAVHELATNALKFGALTAASGRIRIKWRLLPVGMTEARQHRLVFEWQESGVPVTDMQPRRSGFGRELIERGLPYQLGADTVLEFRPGGARCVIDLVIAEVEQAPLLVDPV